MVRIRDHEIIGCLSGHPSPSYAVEGLLRVALSVCAENPLLFAALGIKPSGNDRPQSNDSETDDEGMDELLL